MSRSDRALEIQQHNCEERDVPSVEEQAAYADWLEMMAEEIAGMIMDDIYTAQAADREADETYDGRMCDRQNWEDKTDWYAE